MNPVYMLERIITYVVSRLSYDALRRRRSPRDR